MREIIYFALLGLTVCGLSGCRDADSEKKTEVRSGDTVEIEGKTEIRFGDTVEIDGSGAALSGQVLSVTAGGAYELTGSFEGTIYVETGEAVRLILNGVSVTSPEGPAIFVEDADQVWIEIPAETENYLEDAKTYTSGKGTIFSNDDLIFSGEGSLEITGNYKHGISSDDGITISGGSFEITAAKDGIHANEDLVVNGGRIRVTECEEGLESKAALLVNGGTIEVEGTDDGLNGGTLVQINDGTVYVNMTTGDGLDSNGTLEVNGGLVVALGGSMPEGGADCDNNDFLINGGTLIAAGGVNSTPTENKCTAQSVLLGAAAAGDIVGIKDGSGKTVFAFSSPKAYGNLLLAGAFLEEGNTYTVYTGGTVKGTETGYGYYETGEYEGGTESVSFTVDSTVIQAGGTAGMQGPGGGRAPGEGGMPDGGRPEGGMFPGGEEVPEGMEVPGGGVFPGGEEVPEGMEVPEGGAIPGREEVPEGMEVPEGAEI